MWTKTVFWTVTSYQNCNTRRNTDLPPKGENMWENLCIKKFKDLLGLK
jgi:hypothetical protein